MTPNKTKTPRCHNHRSETVKQIVNGLIWSLAYIATALLASLVLLPQVYHSRGYFAIGGEWFLVGIAGFLGGELYRCATTRKMAESHIPKEKS